MEWTQKKSYKKLKKLEQSRSKYNKQPTNERNSEWNE